MFFPAGRLVFRSWGGRVGPRHPPFFHHDGGDALPSQHRVCPQEAHPGRGLHPPLPRLQPCPGPHQKNTRPGKLKNARHSKFKKCSSR